jgi:polyisoprenoid-binding protein YceI
VDLNTIRSLDDNYAPDTAEQGTRSKLIGHLKSADFFDVENHPNATLRIIEANGNTATAEFTVRGITDTETIENINITENNGMVNATGKMTFDRQKYDVRWDSGLQEAVLSDKIELDVDLTGRSQAL